MMKRYNVAMTEEMERRLEAERKKRALDSIPETVRYILSEYLAKT
jgi:Arc/MetJ-type ribon-helix-helix transcriptional regulator